MATFYTSYNEEYSPGVRAEVTYTETTDIAQNVSFLKISAVAQFRSSGNYYRNGVKISVSAGGKTITSNTKSIGIGSYSGYGTTFSFTTDTITIPHNDDGTKTGVTITATLDIQGTKNTGTTTIDLEVIPRGHSFSLNKTMLTEGQSATLTAEKSVSSYTSTITWDNGIMSGQIASNSTLTSWEINYSTISSGIASGMTKTATIACTTYDGETEIATKLLYIAVNTGNIVASFYDDGDGNLGLTLFERATGPGFKVKGKIEIPMVDMIKVESVTIDVPYMASKSYKTVTTSITIQDGYTAIGIISPVVNNAVIAIVGAYGTYNTNGTYQVSMKLVVNYAAQQACSCSCKVLCIYTG